MGGRGHRDPPPFLFAWLQGCGASKWITLSFCWSISIGSAFSFTLTWYSFARGDGTRHEYPHVKPQPYSKLPFWTTLPSGSVMVNSGLPGRPPLTVMFVQASPPTPIRVICRYVFGSASLPSATW